MALSISASNGGNPASQAKTQSPQNSAGSGAPAAAPASRVQPGTASSLLTQGSGNNGASGVALSPTALSVVNLDTSTQTAPAQAVEQLPSKHHLNSFLIILTVGLVALAIISFWTTTRSAKNTTH